MNGRHRCDFLQCCGCVFSGRALKEIKQKFVTRAGLPSRRGLGHQAQRHQGKRGSAAEEQDGGGAAVSQAGEENKGTQGTRVYLKIRCQ